MKRTLKLIISILITSIMLCGVVFAENVKTTCYNSFEEMWASASGSPAYYWNDGAVIKVTWKKLSLDSEGNYKNADNYDDVKDGYGYNEEDYDIADGIAQIGGKYYVFDGGTIKEGTKTEGYASKKEAENGNKSSDRDISEELNVEIFDDYDGWEQDSNGNWKYWVDDEHYLYNNYAIIVADENGDNYNLYKFTNGSYQAVFSNASVEEISEKTVEDSSKNKKATNKKGNRYSEDDDNKEDDEEDNEEDNEDDEDNNGGGGGSDDEDDEDSDNITGAKAISTKLEQVDSIKSTIVLNEVEFLDNETTGVQMFGMCISKDFNKISNMADWYNAEDNMKNAKTWFEAGNYRFNLTAEDLRKASGGRRYDYGGNNVFSYDVNTLKAMQTRVTKVEKQKKNDLVSTVLMIIGFFISGYAILLFFAWVYDTKFNVEYGDKGGFFNTITFGNYIAIADGEVLNTDQMGVTKFHPVNFKGVIKICVLLFCLGLIFIIPVMREFIINLGMIVYNWAIKLFGRFF